MVLEVKFLEEVVEKDASPMTKRCRGRMWEWVGHAMYDECFCRRKSMAAVIGVVVDLLASARK